MKTKQSISLIPLLIISVFLAFTSSCKKDDVTSPDNSTNEETTIEVTFGSMTDQEGNTYKTVTIGTQTWMAENLRTTKYNDGTAIPNITNGNKWDNLTTGAYCAYSTVHYGKLYNWYAVNTGKLTPEGWHIPTKNEWTQLIDYLGGDTIAGGKLKETGTAHWYSPNTGATNEIGFTALPGGLFSSLDLYGYGEQGMWWSTTEDDYLGAYTLNMNYYGSNASIGHAVKELGISVRCICDEIIEGSATDTIENDTSITYGTMTDQEGNVYTTVTIGTQTWMAENLHTTNYNDGTAIPNVTDDYEWDILTTGAYCNYNNTTSTDTIFTYGRLYNWYAVNTKKLAPEGWHVATDEDWNTLTIALGGEGEAGGKLKEKGTAHWNNFNTGATNEIGFTALPGGSRYMYFSGLGFNGYWWSASEHFDEFNWYRSAWCRGITHSSPMMIRAYYYTKMGCSIRCVKD
ncbi:MAG: fibrobacter succinogenes major paralogous domain-containing protein [Prolixibacteraceae bacterium]|jgi:uncharacterized protein (TIGR02145 family)|nr:fibrobacter succinogenes major paralogous domain-containing protein [Prolixibacteraceae bacterium]